MGLGVARYMDLDESGAVRNMGGGLVSSKMGQEEHFDMVGYHSDFRKDLGSTMDRDCSRRCSAFAALRRAGFRMSMLEIKQNAKCGLTSGYWDMVWLVLGEKQPLRLRVLC